MFKGKSGTGATGADDDMGSGLPDASPESIVLERVKTFAKDMLKSDEVKDDSAEGEDDSAAEKKEVQVEVVKDSDPSDHEDLMSKFKSVASLTSVNLLHNVLSTSMSLEKADKGSIKGAVSDV